VAVSYLSCGHVSATRLVTAGEHEKRCAPLVRSSKMVRVSEFRMRGRGPG
jgi:hypothetical protein